MIKQDFIKVIKEIIATLIKTFEGQEEIMGCYINFEYLYLDLIAINTQDMKKSDLSCKVASLLVEAGLFEIRIYSEDTKDIWCPLGSNISSKIGAQTYQEFKAQHIRITGFHASQSQPGLREVRSWVGDYFND